MMQEMCFQSRNHMQLDTTSTVVLVKIPVPQKATTFSVVDIYYIMEATGEVIRPRIKFLLTNVECVELCPLTLIPSSDTEDIHPLHLTMGPC